MSLVIKEIIDIAETRLRKAGCTEARHDAEELMRHILNYDRSRLFMNLATELNEKNCEAYFDLVDLRASRKPLQYIIGSAEFMGVKIKVDERVLIPRQETETLVAVVLKYMSSLGTPFGGWRVLDIGVGSGAIAVSLCARNKDVRVVAGDISEDALVLAKKNAALAGVTSKIRFINSDLFGNIDIQSGRRQFHIIVSNPPYIKRRLIPLLQKEISGFEPVVALDGGYDGLDFYRAIAADAYKYLRKKGRLFLEIGYDQAENVTEIFKTADFYEDMRIFKDLGGNDRVFTATTP